MGQYCSSSGQEPATRHHSLLMHRSAEAMDVQHWDDGCIAAQIRQPTAKEVHATSLLALTLDKVSAKVRLYTIGNSLWSFIRQTAWCNNS